jgi:hypothetical protein
MPILTLDTHDSSSMHQKTMTEALRIFWLTNQWYDTSMLSILLKDLNWEPLRTRRLRARHILLKKLRAKKYRGDIKNIILTPDCIYSSERSDKIRKIRSRIDTFKYSFFPLTISEHNKIKVPKEGST